VSSAAWEPIDATLADVGQGRGGLPTAVGYGALFAAGLTVGLLSLVAYERVMTRVKTAAPDPVVRFGPGTMATAEARSRHSLAPLRPGTQVGPPDRGRDRPAQLRRGPGHGPVRRDGTDRPSHRPGRRVSPCTTPPKGSGSSPLWPPQTPRPRSINGPAGRSCSAWPPSAEARPWSEPWSVTPSPAN
jgi:hypothetical protein